MSDTFTDKLRCGGTVIGSVLTLPSPEIAEILSGSGFDFLIADAEHSALDVSDVQRLLMAARDGCPVLVRVPVLDGAWIKKYLDTGPDGIIIPMVNSAESAKLAVRLCRYPPLGERSVGIARAHDYGMSFGEYVANADERVAVIIQIEHIDAVGHIHDILKVPGIDAVFIGPYDLSGSMGKIGRVNDDDVRSHVETVRNACTEAGIPVGIYGIDAAAAKALFSQGYSFVVTGMDAMFLWRSARDITSFFNK